MHQYWPSSLISATYLSGSSAAGRPNVGKSALFNRIVGKKAAIVYDTPGVTRDRLYVRSSWGGREFVLVDTGGLMSSASELPSGMVETVAEVSAADLPHAIEWQAASAIAEASVVVMVCDGQEGPTAADEQVISWLRKTHSDKGFILAVNKCESSTQGAVLASMFWGYGHEPLAVSAISGSGTGDLMERLVMVRLPCIHSHDAHARLVAQYC
jgi:GTPase